MAAGRDLIVVGASAGGVETLTELARALPAGMPATLFVVCHFPAGGTSHLPEILSRAGPLLARHARDGEPFYPGHIYVAPPDYHMLTGNGSIRLVHGPRENGYRPSIDTLFRSAARAYGTRVIGVILTGALSDGVAGLLAVRSAGGIAIVQSPEDAIVASLPENASRIAGADYIVPVSALAQLLMDLVNGHAATQGESNMMDPLDNLSATVGEHMALQMQGRRHGEVSVFTCPECGGALWQLDQKELVRFSCHVGHVYNGDVLLAEQSEALEAALWTAVRTFKEKTVLSRQLAKQERARGNQDAAERFDEQGDIAQRHGALIQRYILGNYELQKDPQAEHSAGAKGGAPVPPQGARDSSPAKTQREAQVKTRQ